MVLIIQGSDVSFHSKNRGRGLEFIALFFDRVVSSQH